MIIIWELVYAHWHISHSPVCVHVLCGVPQDFHVYRGRHRQLENELEKMKDRLQTAEQDKDLMLEYIEEMQVRCVVAYA